MTRFDFSRNQVQTSEFVTWTQRDASLGQNSRQNGLILAENQSEELYNVDLTIPGKRMLRDGSVMIANDVGSNSVVCLATMQCSDGDQLFMAEGANLRNWTGAGNWSSAISGITLSGTDISIVPGKESGLSPDDIVIVQDGTSNAFRVDQAGNIQDLGDTNTSPPKSTVGTWYGNRFWYLLNDELYYSDAYDSDYSGAFDRTSNKFRVPVGDERALSFTRDLGMIVGGRKSIWVFNPSATPATTDQPQPALAEFGIVSKQGWCVGGDDWYFFSHDGLRALKRTIQDKLQLGTSFPLSYQLLNEWDDINWARISELSMVYYDNKVICSVPTGASSFMTWVYYTSLQSMTVWGGWTPRCWAKYQVGGAEYLYYGTLGDGKVYRALYGRTDEGTSTINGTAITFREITKKIDFGKPIQRKEGHIFEIKGDSVGNYNITCHVQLDDGGWESLGTFIPLGNTVTFPITFPVTLYDVGEKRQKFHMRDKGKFQYCQFKYQLTAAYTTSDPLVITETNAVAIVDPYMEENN